MAGMFLLGVPVLGGVVGGTGLQLAMRSSRRSGTSEAISAIWPMRASSTNLGAPFAECPKTRFL